MKKFKKINLALQGGGAHGAFAWGILDYLLETNLLEIDSISATSAGAMNAVILAQGYILGGNEGAREALSSFWQQISSCGQYLSPVKKTFWESWLNTPIEQTMAYNFFSLATELFSPYQFNPLNFNPLRDLLKKNVNFEVIRNNNKVKLSICATNVRTGKVRIFTNNEISLEAILASACLPHLFQAIQINGDSYWDGGYMGNPPIYPLIYTSDIKDILIIHINPIVRDKLPRTVPEILNRINEISFNSSLMREMRAIAFVTKLIEEKWLKEEYFDQLKKVNMHSIRADEHLVKFSVASKFNTDFKFLIQLFNMGRAIGKNWFDKNFEKIGNESTMDLNDFL